MWQKVITLTTHPLHRHIVVFLLDKGPEATTRKWTITDIRNFIIMILIIKILSILGATTKIVLIVADICCF